MRLAMYGVPGPVYLELPADVSTTRINRKEITFYPSVDPLPNLILPPNLVESTLALLKNAKAPLVIIGKGMAYGNAEEEMRAFIDRSGLPFLPTPMGKGVVDDSHSSSVATARTFALKTADVVFLAGARLNWILHFGEAPRFNKNVKIIQLDFDPMEISNNVKATIPLVGDAKTIMGQLATATKDLLHPKDSDWWKGLQQSIQKNKGQVDAMMND